MSDLHDFHLCLAHGWGQHEVQRFHAPRMFHAYTPSKTTIPRFISAKDIDSEPVIPNPSIFKSLSKPPPDSRAVPLPSIGECATHLELLEAIYHLRTEVISTTRLDGAFGQPPASNKMWRKKVVAQRYYHVKVDILDENYKQRCEEKWVLFLRLAVARFEIWAKESEAVLKETQGTAIPYLPPLDVLAVWHSFLLNPGDYMKYCKQRELERLPFVQFPWDRIHESIDSKPVKFSFKIPGADADWFADATRQPLDLFNAIEKAQGKQHGLLWEALLDLSDPDYTDPHRADAILSQMEETEEDYQFVRLLYTAKASADAAKPLGEPLVDNVIRQGAFVDKMHSQLWLRSPAFEGTLERAIDRYDKLTQLFRDHPRQMIVPTLDMDLVWHTHQLSHRKYLDGIWAITGRFIDHDDKVGKGTLGVKEGETRRLFEDTFDEEYARCMCWDCEAIFSAVEEVNQMRPDNGYLEDLASKVRGEVQYYRAAEVVRRKAWPRMDKRVAPLPTKERIVPSSSQLTVPGEHSLIIGH